MISLASFLEMVHSDLRGRDEALQFLQPVNFKKVPDYLDKVRRRRRLQMQTFDHETILLHSVLCLHVVDKWGSCK